MPKQYTQTVNIKSKYLGFDEPRRLIIDPSTAQIAISHSGNPN